MKNDSSNLDISTKRALARLLLQEQELFELLVLLGLFAQHAHRVLLPDLERLYELLPGVIGAYRPDFNPYAKKPAGEHAG